MQLAEVLPENNFMRSKARNALEQHVRGISYSTRLMYQ
jgi:hypothetical protein